MGSWLKPLSFTYRGIIYCSKFEQRDGEHIFGEAEMIQSTISLLRSMNISQSCWIQNAHQCQRESNSVFSSFSQCRLFLIHPCLPPLLKQPENCQLYHNFYLLHFQDHPHIYTLLHQPLEKDAYHHHYYALQFPCDHFPSRKLWSLWTSRWGRVQC